MGAEYALVTPKRLIPTIRGWIFYDPAPAPKQPDDFYGVSLGLGMTFREKKKLASRRKKRKERRDIMSIDTAFNIAGAGRWKVRLSRVKIHRLMWTIIWSICL